MAGTLGRMALVVLCVLSIPLLAAADQSFKVRIQRVSEYYAAHYAKHYRVPVELVEAIIEVESGWNPLAQSTQGAAGLMQLMPATAARFQVKNHSNIEQNIRGGVEYLAQLSRLFQRDLRLVTAAYVAGESRVLRKKLAYTSPEVLAYVNEVACIYRQKQKSN